MQRSEPTLPALPSDVFIANIASLLSKQSYKEEHQQKYAPVKEILALLGRGAILTGALLAPKSAPFFLSLIQESPDWETWKHYNVCYLRRTLRRLQQQKNVELVEEKGMTVIRLTENGKRKILKYSLKSLTIDKPRQWDGKWRLVLYDVPTVNKPLGDLIRQTLRTFGFYAIQDSVYLSPYPCFDQIEFLREYYQLGEKVQYMVVERIEHDDAYKTYFNLR